MTLQVPNSEDAELQSNSGHWLLLGICGSGMRGLARILLDRGQRVSGTDADAESLEDYRRAGERVQTFPWYRNALASEIGATKVVHSVAVPADDPQLTAARAAGIPVLTLPEAIASLFENSRQLCVAGTHGKTTTAGMVWWILSRAGLNPGGFVGGQFAGSGDTVGPNCNGSGQETVLESCEYRRSFLGFRPQTAVVTGIEPDHFDCFHEEFDSDAAYLEFIRRLAPDGTMIINQDLPRTAALCRAISQTVIRYGIRLADQWSIAHHCELPDSIPGISPVQEFVVTCAGRPVTRMQLRVPGLHNSANALAAMLTAGTLGIRPDHAAESLVDFPGMRRRFEYRGQWNGAAMFDDYAHHPTAVAATLQTARALYRERRVVVVFEPHQVSRATRLHDQFTTALSLADECLLLPVLPVRENSDRKTCCELSGQLVRSVSRSGCRAFLMANLDQALGRLDHSVRPGDVVITMGAGRTNQIHDELHRRFQRNSAA